MEDIVNACILSVIDEFYKHNNLYQDGKIIVNKGRYEEIVDEYVLAFEEYYQDEKELELLKREMLADLLTEVETGTKITVDGMDASQIIDKVIDDFKDEYNIEKSNEELFGDLLMPYEFLDYQRELKNCKTREQVKYLMECMSEDLKEML